METEPVGVRSRRIIPRPRLLRALSATSARIRLLVASAGYGKTTLAEQWELANQFQASWVRVGRSDYDVALLARRVARASALIVPTAGERLLQRLCQSDNPEDDAGLLAELLADDLKDWPNEAWMIIDDYHHLSGAESTEVFVETLVKEASANFLIASRQRPSWISSRDILYGTVLETGRSMLAMTADEIDLVLDESAHELSVGLLALADGWPAVVGMSSSLRSDGVDPNACLPEDLFDFFADEVFRRLAEPVQVGLCGLALLPVIDRDVAVCLLGQDLADQVIRDAMAVGILDRRGEHLDLHPLARSFLERRSAAEPLPKLRSALAVYRSRADWDSAFELADRLKLDDEVQEIIRDGLPSLLESGRLATLQTWLSVAESRGFESLQLRIAEAELNVRQGRLLLARTVLERDLTSPPHDRGEAFALYSTAARASHVAALETEALEYYRRARDLAETREERRTILEGQLMCSATLELSDTHDLLFELRSSLDPASPTEVVRLADRVMMVGFRFGKNPVHDVRSATELITRVRDPLSVVSFYGLYAWGLVLACEYESALSYGGTYLSTCREYRVGVAESYARALLAAALAGLRRFDESENEIRLAVDAARQLGDDNAANNAYAIHVRVLLHQGRIAEACRLDSPTYPSEIPFIRGEALASRALALAAIGRFEQASLLARQATASTLGVETRVLASVTRALIGVSQRDGAQVSACEDLVSTARDAMAPDLMLAGCRAAPSLLGQLLAVDSTRDYATEVVQKVDDTELCTTVGARALSWLDPAQSLSRREREVYLLLCEGLSNAAIGRTLFISESTVKSHVNRIYNKTGIRNRSALALRARQAAPEVTERGDDPSSSDSVEG